MKKIQTLAVEYLPAFIFSGVLLLSACGAQSVSHKPEPAPAASPSQEAPPESKDAQKETDRGIEGAEFDRAEESQDESPGAFDDGPHSTAQKRKSRLSMMESLETEMLGLDEAFRPEQLSCSGAEPHRDAICSIAERICSLDTPLNKEGAKDCERARKSCSDAKKRYEQKCS